MCRLGNLNALHTPAGLPQPLGNHGLRTVKEDHIIRGNQSRFASRGKARLPQTI